MTDPQPTRPAPTAGDDPGAAPAGRARALVVSAVAWVLTAVFLVVAFSGLQPESNADDETLGTIRSQVGDAVVGPGATAPFPTWLLLVAAVLLVAAAVALLLRRRAARYPAVVLGVVSVVLLAVAGRWETVPAMVLLVVGTLALLTPSSVRSLH